jgi:hypothetical protein
MTIAAESSKTKQHWIYPLGDADLLLQARDWAERKTRQGKSYAVIEASRVGPPARRLAHVDNADVLYVYAGAVRDGNLGDWMLDPAKLAEQLHAEGLDPHHRSLKLFASFTGDAGGSSSYAERLYEAMRAAYPRITVFGFLGKVDAGGFDGHKTAGLDKSESLTEMTREDWLSKGARARDNRVQFPPEA